MKIQNKQQRKTIILNHSSIADFKDKYLQNMYSKTAFFFID